MRRIVFTALMISLLILCACGGGEGEKEDKFLKFRDELEAASNIGMTAEIKADCGETVETYTLGCSKSGDTTTIEVLAPELIAGIRATVGGDPMSVEFDGAILETGELGLELISPVTAVPVMLEALTGDHINRIWNEKTDEAETLVADIMISDAASITVWLDQKTMIPLYAEIYIEETAVIYCRISDWQMG